MTHNTGRRDLLGPWWIHPLALALFFIRFGYGFGLGDQDEILPFLYHLLDPSLFENDWFVQTQSGGFSVRTFFVYTLWLAASLMAVETAVLVVYLVLWISVSASSYRLLKTIGISSAAAAGATVIALGILHKWTLGSNDLVYSMLVPEMAAWALALPAIRMHFEGRHLAAAVLLGLAAWFQVLVGLLVFGILFSEALWAAARDRRPGSSPPTRLLRMATAFIAASLPVSIPIFLQQVGTPSLTGDVSIFYILGPFRNPVHHMLFSFPTKSVIRFALIALTAAVALRSLGAHGHLRHAVGLRRIGILILAGCLIMMVFTEWIPALPVAKLQLYKLTVLFKLLALGLIAEYLWRLVPAAVARAASRLVETPIGRASAGLVALACCALVWLASPTLIESRLIGRTHLKSDLGMMERWIRDNTRQNDVFAIPPSNSSFRSTALRAVAVNYMAFPYDDRNMLEWFRRIQAFAPVGTPETGLGIRPQLDYAFERLDAARLRDLDSEFALDYVLRQTPLDGFELVHEEGHWKLYRPH